MTEPYPGDESGHSQDDDRPLDDLPDSAFDSDAPPPQGDFDPPTGEDQDAPEGQDA